MSNEEMSHVISFLRWHMLLPLIYLCILHSSSFSLQRLPIHLVVHMRKEISVITHNHLFFISFYHTFSFFSFLSLFPFSFPSSPSIRRNINQSVIRENRASATIRRIRRRNGRGILFHILTNTHYSHSHN